MINHGLPVCANKESELGIENQQVQWRRRWRFSEIDNEWLVLFRPREAAMVWVKPWNEHSKLTLV